MESLLVGLLVPEAGDGAARCSATDPMLPLALTVNDLYSAHALLHECYIAGPAAEAQVESVITGPLKRLGRPPALLSASDNTYILLDTGVPQHPRQSAMVTVVICCRFRCWSWPSATP